nr:DUF4158 domain-containing protein [Streptomyces spongiicola]
MPVEFLADEQAEAYGKFAEEPTRPELERFFLEDVDRDLIARRRSAHHQLGFAPERCTVRYIGRFLPDDPLGAPWPVVEYLTWPRSSVSRATRSATRTSPGCPRSGTET